MLSNMSEIIVGLFMFSIILFFYLHIQFHFKVSNDLEIYEVDNVSKERIEEICDLRQPVILEDNEMGYLSDIINYINIDFLTQNYRIFEIKIKNVKETNDDSNCVPLPLHVATKLFKDDKESKYFSEGNNDFLSETGAIKHISYNDAYFRPSLVSNCYYDVMFGSTNVETPLRYDLNYRNYYMVTKGSVQIKLTPPKSSKYLYPINDYENFEFKSMIDVWNPQQKYRADYDKIRFLEITLVPGKILYIPAYWWYSFKFGEDTSIVCCKYRTYMNNIAISNHIFMYALQNQNIDRKIVKQIKLNQNKLKETIPSNTDDTSQIQIDEQKRE
jgi:hypothetical protein